MWQQIYDPLGNAVLSTLCAGLPIAVLMGALGIFRVRAHWAALLGLGTSFVIAVGVFGMPSGMALGAAAYGGVFGLFPIGWIVLNVLFLYRLTHEQGLFHILKESIASATADPRLQLLLVAFCFGAFFEGVAGFGAPVAVTGAILIGLGFSPLKASGLSLIANTAPVAFGSMGIPITSLQVVTGLDLHDLSSMVGRQLPVFPLIIPLWLMAAYAGMRGALAVWPAALVAGVFFAVPQCLVSNLHGPWLVDNISAVISMGAVLLLLRFWHPKEKWAADENDGEEAAPARGRSHAEVFRAWLPWLILSVVVFTWGIPSTQKLLNGISNPQIPVPWLHQMIERVPPVVAAAKPEEAIFKFNWLSASGTGILLSALLAGLAIGCSPRQMALEYWRTLKMARISLLTIAAMMSVGFLTRYSGLDATLGLAFASTGWFYPLFGTMLGWLGVALTGSDTSSNVLFGSLQTITASQLGLSPVMMASANSTGGVMGKMIDAQSIVVAGTATGMTGREGEILRFVFLHSIVLAILVGLYVLLQAYVFPFNLVTIP
ncbi:MAG: L-lactate permease [Candidatus Hydrogenedentes bacterium]|nr:L-lactate permease [Candidatus Hydrogenedentota bacterium]